MNLTSQQANAVYDILVRMAGADNRAESRENFVQLQVEGCREYRFCGALGYGGKFWNSEGRWYVTAYPEDQAGNSDLELIINHANGALYELKKFFSVLAATTT